MRTDKDTSPAQKWRRAHPEQWAEIQRRYEESHKAERAAYGRAWRAANPDKVKAQLKASAERRSQASKARYAADPERFKAAVREYQRTPEAKVLARRRLLARKYNMSLEEYTERGDAQRWLCISCGGKPNQLGLVVDHDHATGKVRGLLCSKCNSALGLLDDDLKKVRNLVSYLRRHQRETLTGQ
jgi:hypothetical protein